MPSLDHIFTFKIGGEAGQGIKSIGLTFAKICTRSGYHVFNYIEYPSLIRGGHNVMQIGFAKEEIHSPTLHTNFLIAFNQETVDLHHEEIVDGGFILFDSELNIKTDKVKKTVNIMALPLAKIALESGGEKIMSNTVAIGAALAVLDGNLKHLKDLIAEEFKDKKPEVVTINQKAAQAGFDFATKNFAGSKQKVLTQIENCPIKMVINANEACALGAIAAGVQFVAIYPMTPTSNILHNLAPYQAKYNFIYKQPEDEISAINMAIGAANAGARSLTATSGGGFCLMAEGYGLAGLSETPIVIIEGMRNAPATGMPTWNEQGDLKFLLNAHQGDFPKIVLSAGDSQEAFDLTLQAFNLADKYQTPVVLIVDKLLCENDHSVSPFKYDSYQVNQGKYTDKKEVGFKRYQLSPNGISPRTKLGVGNFFLANSDEHDETSYSTEESKTRNQQMEKRMQKLKTCSQEDMPKPQLFGPEQADLTIVSWGSNKGSILDAIKFYPNVNFLYLKWINPFPTEEVSRILKQAKYLLNIEQNISGQMASVIREKTGIEILDNMLKYDGRPIYPEEVIERIESILRK